MIKKAKPFSFLKSLVCNDCIKDGRVSGKHFAISKKQAEIETKQFAFNADTGS